MLEMGSDFDEVDWLEHQHLYQNLSSMGAQSAEGTGVYHPNQCWAPYSEHRRERTPVEHWGQNSHPTSTHPQHHVGFEGYSAEQPPSRAMNQDPGSIQVNAVHSVNRPNGVYETMENRHAPPVPAYNPTYYQDESAPIAYSDTRIQTEFSQQAQTNFSNSLHGTANYSCATNIDALSHLVAHVNFGDAYGTPNSPGGDPQSQQYYGQESEIAIDPALYRDDGHSYIAKSIPGSSSEAHDGIVIRLDAPNSEPWTAIGLMDGGQTTRSTRQIPTGMSRMTLDATHSMSAYGDPSSVSSTGSGFETLWSSAIQPLNQTDDVSSEFLYFPPSSGPGSQIGASDSYKSPLGVAYTPESRTHSQNQPWLIAERAATTARARGHLGRYPRSDPGNCLRLPGKRRASSASSHITEAFSSSAVSRPGQGVLECGMNGCEATFTGRHGKGNRARHRRDYHGGKEPIICEDSKCDKVFKRSDARLKHYRSHHPHLVCRNTQVSRRGRQNSAPGNLDVDA